MIQVSLGDLLKARGKTRYWLAKQTGMSQIAISNLCAGKTQRIDFDTMSAVCTALNCQPNDWLLNTSEEKVAPPISRKLSRRKFNKP